MSSEPSKVHGTTESVIGTIKENAGYVIGNEKLEAEGKAQKLAGDAEYKAAQAVQAAEAKTDRVVGATKETVGSLLGNESLEAKGKAQNAEGKVEDATNI
eukprot:TRINITY_DN12423_c0_g1_i1.p1 TRINITY_DN12423_c0_g1~~TRINITY_DN12423_c0_g1_i1.p1  ORF type:complete len:107 (-),score=31.46 TRINITY_DN12423_c0_g1_i1:116-415(-)